jgi:predicted nucleic acid-binding protein
MPLVVTDTSPVFYLLSIGQFELLPALFGKISVPEAVHNELCHPAAPALVREWAASPPLWAEVTAVESLGNAALLPLGAGERAAISLALSRRADLILMDERKGTRVALKYGFAVAGTLGVLALGARRGMVDLADSFARLKGTNFRYRQGIMDTLLDQDASRNL